MIKKATKRAIKEPKINLKGKAIKEVEAKSLGVFSPKKTLIERLYLPIKKPERRSETGV